MNIQKCEKQYNQNFGALHVAKCGNLNVYKIVNTSDVSFVKAIPSNIIGTKYLMPGLSKKQYKVWDKIIKYAADASKFFNLRDSYLVSSDNKPCGLINFIRYRNSFNLDFVCTWPVEFGKKVKFAGKALIHQMFKDFETSDAGKITLNAINEGPFDSIAKYKDLGFRTNSKTKLKRYTPMEITKNEVVGNLSELTSQISYEKVPEKEVDLFKILSF